MALHEAKNVLKLFLYLLWENSNGLILYTNYIFLSELEFIYKIASKINTQYPMFNATLEFYIGEFHIEKCVKKLLSKVRVPQRVRVRENSRLKMVAEKIGKESWSPLKGASDILLG